MNTEAKMLIGVGLVTLVIIGGAVWVANRSNSPSVVDPALLVRANSHQTTPSATVALVEFGDFECPSCAAVHPVLKKLKEDYGDRLNFVFRHFPLSMHKHAMLAAEAAEAAGAQGKFFEMHDLLLEQQEEWASSSSPKEFFVKYAQSLNLATTTFTQALEARTYEAVVREDMADGTALGVASTPTLFINNQQIKGGVSYDGLKAEIAKYLAPQPTSTTTPAI